MNKVEQLQHMMNELGPYMNLDGVYEHDDISWSLFVDSNQEILIDHIPTTFKIVISTYLEITDRDNKELSAILLQYNFLRLSNGGYSIGTSADSKAYLFLDIATENIHLQDLSTSIFSFYRRTMFLKKIWFDISSKNAIDTKPMDLSETKHDYIKV